MKIFYSYFFLSLAIIIFLFSASCEGKKKQNNSSDEINLSEKKDSAQQTTDQTDQKGTELISEKKEIVQTNDNNFSEIISNGVVLVDFWATWCGPCRMQAPILEEVNKEMAGKVTVAKLDIDKNKKVTDQYGVMNIPTLLLFKNGKLVNQFVGLTQKEVLLNAINDEL